MFHLLAVFGVSSTFSAGPLIKFDPFFFEFGSGFGENQASQLSSAFYVEVRQLELRHSIYSQKKQRKEKIQIKKKNTIIGVKKKDR